MSGPVTNTAPANISTATGFTVACAVAGGSPNDYGLVSWFPTGHGVLTPAGISALASACASYHGALASLTNGEQICLHGPAGSFAVKNMDLATQQAAIVAVLANASNVTGKAS